MTERDGFMQAIIEHPDDDAPRLIYADWLEERGENERAEFIRVQCMLAQGPSSVRCSQIMRFCDGVIAGKLEQWKPLRERECVDICCLASLPDGSSGHWVTASGVVDTMDHFSWDLVLRNVTELKPWSLYERERELKLRREPSWVLDALGDQLRHYVDDRTQPCGWPYWKWHRGFISEITLSCQDWLTHRESLLRACPLERVTLTEHPAVVTGSAVSVKRGQVHLYHAGINEGGRIWDLSFPRIGKNGVFEVSLNGATWLPWRDSSLNGHPMLASEVMKEMELMFGNPHAPRPQGVIHAARQLAEDMDRARQYEIDRRFLGVPDDPPARIVPRRP